MGATFVMSYPAAGWSASAGRSAASADAKPRAALEEWIALADAIVLAGGHILVCDPPGDAGAPSLPFAADWGAMVRRNDQPLFLVPRPTQQRAAETDAVRAFFGAAGVTVQDLACATSGRGDLVQVSPGRYLFLAGAHTDAGAAALIARELGATTRFIEGAVAAPFRFGDEVVAALQNKGGDLVLLAHEAGLRGRSLPDLRAALQRVDVLAVDAEDAAAGACAALCVNGTVILPTGLSTALRGNLLRRGFQLVELELAELRAHGGGAHALVNELFGFVIGDGAPDYARNRERIAALLETYPT
jgi:N-dimethylarginine dimethylaminohydrolase